MGCFESYTALFEFPVQTKVVRETILRQRAEDMRFHLVDRILEIEAGKSIRAVKNLALGEEYLADHFPTFPVMPGVLMLQTLIEAASWLLRATDDFRYSVIAVREVKGVKYGTFMDPGKQMQISVDLVERNGPLATFKGKGEANGAQTVSARFTLGCYNLGEANTGSRLCDERLTSELRQVYSLIRGDLLPGQNAAAIPAKVDGKV